MSFFGQPTRPAQNEDGFDDVLPTSALRTELVTVIALCSDAMRRDVLSFFEPPKDQQQPAAVESLIDFDDAAILKPLSTAEEAKDNRQRQLADVQSPRTHELRKAAITFFDKWQVDVLRRMGEVLQVRPDAIRKARADAKAQATAAVKARQDRAYYDWAHGKEGEPSNNANPQPTHDGCVLPEGFRPNILQLPKSKRTVILDSVLLLLLSLEQYIAHSRVLMLHLTRVLDLPENTLVEHESKVAEGLLASAAAKMSASQSTKRQADEDASARRWKVGLATIAGAALIGVTGGLAAPFLAAGVGTIMGGLGLGAIASLLGPLATNMVLVGGLFGAYGGKMTGGIMEKYAQEVRDFKFMPLAGTRTEEPVFAPPAYDDEYGLAQLQNPDTCRSHKLRVAIGISGSITEVRDFIDPWKILSSSRLEAFALRWERDALKQLGKKLSEVVQNAVMSFVGYKLVGMLISGLWPFGLMRAARTLDSPFAVAKSRSDKAGKVLADALIHKVQGGRPVTLVGYSLGARVIYSCLLQLAEQKVFGLVESVVVMGAPTPSDFEQWRRIRSVVSGRLVNVYSGDDLLLGFMYRASSAQLGIAGVQEIEGIAGVENYDVTDLVKGHDKYRLLVGTILQRIGFTDLDNEAVRQQQTALRQAQQRDETHEQGQDMRSLQDRKRDTAFAKEDEQGHIIFADDKIDKNAAEWESTANGTNSVEGRLPNPIPVDDHTDSADDLEHEDSGHQITMADNDEPMSHLDPTPEPDFGSDQETVSFGSGTRGFEVQWDYNRR